MNYKQIIAQKL